MTESGRDVVVLGAGFSRAISAVMPLTDELGNSVFERLDLADRRRSPVRRFSDGRFEEWLSFLSEPQPQFLEDRILESRALLLRVTRTMCDVLTERQLEALAGGAPEWLEDFLVLAHLRRSVLVTLNYDNLIECAVAMLGLPLGSAMHRVTEDDILRGLPPAAHPEAEPSSSHAAFSGVSVLTPRDPSATFELLKLHGSLSWYWTPGDLTGMSIQRWRLPGTFENLELEDPEEKERRLVGREAYIVPPAATKSGYLQSPLVRASWRRADRALRNAGRIVLVGYSVPQADQALGGLLADAMRGRGVALEVVNPKPRGPVARLHRLGGSSRKVLSRSEDSAIEEWTRGEQDTTSRGVIEKLLEADLTGEELLFAGLRSSHNVADVVREGDEIVLVLSGAGAQVRTAQSQCLLDLLARTSG